MTSKDIIILLIYFPYEVSNQADLVHNILIEVAGIWTAVHNFVFGLKKYYSHFRHIVKK